MTMELPELEVAADGPLRGIKVLDLSRLVAGPMAAMSLGELGATVIKVERTGSGDDVHLWGPPFVESETPYFLGLNRNKYGLALDLGADNGRAVIRRLAVEWADVVIENFKEGTLERWGIGLDSLRAANPRLITGTVRGYPEGDSRPGYDFVIQAGTGLMALTGPADGDPYRVGYPICDVNAGQFLLSGLLAALLERERSGLGQHVSVSLWEAQAAVLVSAHQLFLMTGRVASRVGNGNISAGPYGLYPTKTTAVALCCGNDSQFVALAQALGHPEWIDDPELHPNKARVVNKERVDALMIEAFAERTAEEVIELVLGAGVPCGPLRTIDEVYTAPEAAQMIATTQHATIGEIPAVLLPWRFSRTPSGAALAAPTLGQHNDTILPHLEHEEPAHPPIG